MLCPKCKKQIPEKSVKCEHCGARIATFCKKCHAYNSIYNLNCVNCNNELLKLCPSCKSVNFPNAPKCRKCGYGFVQDTIPAPETTQKTVSESVKEVIPKKTIKKSEVVEKVENVTQQEAQSVSEPEVEKTEPSVEKINFDYNIETYSQQMAKDFLVQGLMSDEKKIISLCGQKGIGKSIVLKSAIHELKDNNIIWLVGECSAITQLSPCGLIQDILLSFFNISNFCSDSLKLKKESQRFFRSEFPSLTNDEIFNLLNFLYPTNADYFENILKNKDKTFIFLEKVFKTITQANKTVFVIENFDMIDGLSYEFLHNILNIPELSFKVLLTYDDVRPVRGYLYANDLENDAYLDIPLKAFDKNQMNLFIEQYLPNEDCPQDVKDKIFAVSAGNPAVMEQLVNLLIDYKTRNNSLEVDIPSTMNDVINLRLEYLKENPVAYHILMMAAIQGIKLYPAIINQILNLEENQFIEHLDILQKLNFIMPVNEFSYAFKNSTLWESVLEVAKTDENFAVFNQNLFLIYSNYILSSHSIIAVLAQNVNEHAHAFAAWTDNTKLAAYIGDTNLYAISQKQCQILVDNLDNIDTSLIKNNIFERLGKILSQSNPNEAMEYLPTAIANAKKTDNILKEIELTGYLANCCISLGNYYGTLECIDSVIARIDYSLDLERAMLKSRKLDALLNVGNCGEIVNLVDNEIMPVFEKYINAKPHKTISINALYKAWLQTYLSLANALIMQGSNRAFQVLGTLFDLFEKNQFDDDLFICKTKLAMAFANTMKGDVSASEEILGEVIKVYKTDIMDNEAISRWNLINILNNFLHKKYSGIQEELFQVVTFANNINDHFTKNILKTLLGKLFKDQESAKKALDIYSEQITYFAKEKNAIGALLTWYFIAEANLVVEGPDKSLEVSQKALEVAQGPKINNYAFIVLFNKVIAEAYMAQAEYELAKAHIEKAVLIARKFELLQFLSDLYLLYGKYLQDMALLKTDSQVEYISGAAKMYSKSLTMALGLKNNYLVSQVEKAKTVLNSFCQLNGITIRDDK